MKALAIDSSSKNMIIAARNEENTFSVSSDISMKQSEKILPLIDFVLKEGGLEAKDLDFSALCSGPGTFTGLRLGYSALKAISLSNGKPVYAVPTMEVLAHPFVKNAALKEKTIVPVVDAKKNQFFAAAFKNGKKTIEAQDITPECFLEKLRKVDERVDAKNDAKIEDVFGEDVFVVGSISKQFAEILKNLGLKNVSYFDSPFLTTNSLFELAAKKIEDGEKPLEDYEGPEYFRKSEAEINLS